jgi:hypothetical protein
MNQEAPVKECYLAIWRYIPEKIAKRVKSCCPGK